MAKRITSVATLLVSLFSLLAACAPPPQADRPTGGLLIYTSTVIWADIVQNITGDLARVESIIPRGADAHDYQASPNVVAQLRRADLVIVNGLDLEEGLESVLAAAERDGVRVVKLGPLLDPQPFRGGKKHDDHDKHDDHGGHGQQSGHGGHSGHGSLDPHVWLDPSRVARAVDVIAARIAAVDRNRPASFWAERAAAYRQKVLDVDAEARTMMATIPAERRRLITNHDAFGYFATRYNFEVIGVVIPGGGTTGQPSASEIAQLARTIRAERVPALFTEDAVSPQVAQALAREAGTNVRVVTLWADTLGEPGSGGETYLGMIRTNARRIADALR